MNDEQIKTILEANQAAIRDMWQTLRQLQKEVHELRSKTDWSRENIVNLYGDIRNGYQNDPDVWSMGSLRDARWI